MSMKSKAPGGRAAKNSLGVCGRPTAGQPVLAALLGGLDDDPLPLVPLDAGILVALDAGDGALGEQRRDFRSAEFGGLLDDEVHVLSLGDRLRQRQAAGQWRRLDLVKGLQAHLALGGIRQDLRGGLGASAVENDELVARIQAQDIERVVRLGLVQAEGVKVPGGGRI